MNERPARIFNRPATLEKRRELRGNRQSPSGGCGRCCGLSNWESSFAVNRALAHTLPIFTVPSGYW